MGGRVMQYSPVEEMINEAKKQKDAEHKAIHEKDQATIASLRAEIARMKAEKSA